MKNYKIILLNHHSCQLSLFLDDDTLLGNCFRHQIKLLSFKDCKYTATQKSFKNSTPSQSFFENRHCVLESLNDSDFEFHDQFSPKKASKFDLHVK